MPREDAYLLDILLMAKEAMDFTKDMDKEAFLSDRKSQFAVIRCFEIIGEATKHRIFHGPRWRACATF